MTVVQQSFKETSETFKPSRWGKQQNPEINDWSANGESGRKTLGTVPLSSTGKKKKQGKKRPRKTTHEKSAG